MDLLLWHVLSVILFFVPVLVLLQFVVVVVVAVVVVVVVVAILLLLRAQLLGGRSSHAAVCSAGASIKLNVQSQTFIESCDPMMETIGYVQYKTHTIVQYAWMPGLMPAW